MPEILFDSKPYNRSPSERRLIRDMPADDQPLNRLRQLGPRVLSGPELLAVCLSTEDALDLSTEILDTAGGVTMLSRASTAELTAISGIGITQASRIRAAIELGRRSVCDNYIVNDLKVTSPAKIANLLMPHMQDLEQEHVVVILLNTRNVVLAVHTVYIGSINETAIKIGELFRHAIRENAAAIILAHNHPGGDPSPSPEDVRITGQVVAAGKLLDITVLDHVIIGRQRFVSLKERGLGFD